ncbi:hypothetical protein [Nocardia sp. NPDC049149]|uniref:hypothetical protein n=1 Tax=Nocardia sp. NPDC049149 TaxID=3364315 RepID=UPI003713B7EA
MSRRLDERIRLGTMMMAALLVCASLIGAPPVNVPAVNAQPPPVPTSPLAPPPPPKRLCEAQELAVQRADQDIVRHNAQRHLFELPREQAAYDAYNVEANAVNQQLATAKANLRRCLDVLQRIVDPGLLAQVTPRQIDKTTTAKNQVPQGYTLPYPAGGKQGYAVPKQSPARELYDVVRKISPPRKTKVTGPLQGQQRPAVGDHDPAYPGGRVGKDAKGGSAVSLDHVVSLAELFHMPGFLALSPENMIMVANTAVGLQWLTFTANRAKQSRSAGDILGTDPNWQAAQVALENQVRSQLLRLIQDLLELQGGP